MPAVVGPKAGLPVVQEPLYTSKAFNNVSTIEEIIIKRHPSANPEEKIPVWLRKTRKLPDSHPGRHLPHEGSAVDTFRAVSRTGHRASSRKRSRQNNQHSSQANSRDVQRKHPISAPLPYLRPLTGLSPPASRERRPKPLPPAVMYDNMSETSSSALSSGLGGQQGRVGPGDGPLVETLARKCQDLVHRLQVVESELREAKAAAAHAPPPPSTHSPHHGPRAARPSSREPLSIEQAEALSHAGYAPPRPVWMGPKTTTIVTPRSQQLKHALYASVDVTVRQLSDQVQTLDDVFAEMAVLDSRRTWAAGKLVLFLRTIFKRRRQRKFTNALNMWRRTHAPDVLSVLAWEVERQRHICERTRFLSNRRSLMLLRDTVAEWQRLTKMHLPRRQRLLQCVERMIVERKRKMLHACCHAWWRVSVGPESGRGIRKKHKERKMLSRQKLQEKAAGASRGVLTPDMIEHETRKLIMEEVSHRFTRSILQRCFSALQQVYDMRRILMKRAKFQHRLRMLKLYFYPWNQWAYLNAQGIAKKKWQGPGRYQIRYNQYQIDTMGRRRLLRYSLQAWRRVIGIYREAHRRYRARLTAFVSSHFLALHHLAKRNMQLRRDVIAAWTDYGRDHCEVPFKMWYLFTEKRRKERETRDRLVRTFRRLKLRQLLSKIMRFWRHQALYGRTGALYTRFELIRSLGQHKDHTRLMLEDLHKQEGSVNDMLLLMDEQTAIIQNHEEQAKRKDEEMMGLSMALSHAEQEMVRMQSLVECVMTIYPTAAMHLLKLQPGFNFRDRGLSPVIQFRLDSTRREGTSVASGLRAQSTLSTSLDAPHTASTVTDSSRVSTAPPSSSPAPLPDRYAWALSLTDPQHVMHTAPRGPSTAASPHPVNESVPSAGQTFDSDKDPVLSVARLYALFHFMRTDDESVLFPSDRALWTQHKASLTQTPGPAEPGARRSLQTKASSGEGGKDGPTSAVAAPPEPAGDGAASMGQPSLLDDDASSLADMSSTMASETLLSDSLGDNLQATGPTKDWPGLTSEAPDAGKRTWSDFMVFLHARLPPKRRTERIEDRMYKQIAADKAHVEAILTATYNGRPPARDLELYSGKVVPPVVTPVVTPLDYTPAPLPPEPPTDHLDDDEEYEDEVEPVKEASPTNVYFPFNIDDSPLPSVAPISVASVPDVTRLPSPSMESSYADGLSTLGSSLADEDEKEE